MTDNTITQSPDDFDWFKNNGIYMPMINDTGRNIAYKAAIERVAPGSVMCDIGTGTGLLSILAAKAGAKKVYSIEMDPGRAKFARDMIDQLGITNIQVINKNFLRCDRGDIPDDIDYFISETIGNPIFNENIVDLSKHAKQWGGTFIPGKIEVTAEIYKNHPILPLVYAESEAFEFQPDVYIDETFEKTINDSFQEKHPADSTLYRFNMINNLFQQLPGFEMNDIDLKFNCEYKHEPFVVDLNDPDIDVNEIKFEITHNEKVSDLPRYCMNGDFAIVLKWQAHMIDDIYMRVEDTIWGSPAKTILNRTRDKTKNVAIWYDHGFQNWRLTY